MELTNNIARACDGITDMLDQPGQPEPIGRILEKIKKHLDIEREAYRDAHPECYEPRNGEIAPKVEDAPTPCGGDARFPARRRRRI